MKIFIHSMKNILKTKKVFLFILCMLIFNKKQSLFIRVAIQKKKKKEEKKSTYYLQVWQILLILIAKKNNNKMFQIMLWIYVVKRKFKFFAQKTSHKIVKPLVFNLCFDDD